MIFRQAEVLDSEYTMGWLLPDVLVILLVLVLVWLRGRDYLQLAVAVLFNVQVLYILASCFLFAVGDACLTVQAWILLFLFLLLVSLFFFRGQRKKPLSFILLWLPFAAQQLAFHYGNFFFLW